ncbi:MAG: phosphatidylserine decarboxylase family protein [Bacteroidetes bacterium]|nr:MAG: phosphatidylserine decarboxylase family protein [Bacteroidota bacterium]
MFAREGYAVMLGAVGLGGLLVWGAVQFGGPWGYILWTLAIFVVLFTFYFFRDPARTPPANSDNLLLAPADGKVILLEEVDDPIFHEGRVRKLSIFLSPLNVHVNRIPATGTIEFVRYIPGDYLVAWHEKASELNERSEIGMVHTSGVKVLFKQIAGAVARRIVYDVKVGDQVRAGDRFGIVKFGSRMDILIPLDFQIHVSVGDKVVGGESILGTFTSQ